MRLRDKIDVIDSNGAIVADDVPAYVGRPSAESLAVLGMPDADMRTLVALVAAESVPELDDLAHRIVWRGNRYSILTPPALHMRGSKPHHYTVALTRVTTE